MQNLTLQNGALQTPIFFLSLSVLQQANPIILGTQSRALWTQLALDCVPLMPPWAVSLSRHLYLPWSLPAQPVSPWAGWTREFWSQINGSRSMMTLLLLIAEEAWLENILLLKTHNSEIRKLLFRENVSFGKEQSPETISNWLDSLSWGLAFMVSEGA